MTRPSDATIQSPPRRTWPDGSAIATCSPETRRATCRVFWRRSNGSCRRPATRTAYSALGRIGKRERISIMGRPSEGKVALRERQLGRRLAGEELAVGAHLVGLGVDLERRLPGVVDHVLLAERARVAHRFERAPQAERAH